MTAGEKRLAIAIVLQEYFDQCQIEMDRESIGEVTRKGNIFTVAYNEGWANFLNLVNIRTRRFIKTVEA